MKDFKAVILTVVQYSTLFIMLSMNRLISSIPVLMLVQFSGLFIAIWAVLEMAKSKLNISPVPRKGSVLIQTGPYKIIRHPMYLSLLLLFPPVIVSNLSVFNVTVFAVFLINLFLKMLYEESLLKDYFKDYKDYSKNTWRLIPLVL